MFCCVSRILGTLWLGMMSYIIWALLIRHTTIVISREETYYLFSFIERNVIEYWVG